MQNQNVQKTKIKFRVKAVSKKPSNITRRTTSRPILIFSADLHSFSSGLYPIIHHRSTGVAIYITENQNLEFEKNILLLVVQTVVRQSVRTR